MVCGGAEVDETARERRRRERGERWAELSPHPHTHPSKQRGLPHTTVASDTERSSQSSRHGQERP